MEPNCPSGLAIIVVDDASMVAAGPCFTLPDGCAIVDITSAYVSLVSAILGKL